MDGQQTLSPLISLQEDFSLGLTPRFNSLGEFAPEQLQIAKDGKLLQLLTSSRSAQEFATASNGAGAGESPRSMRMQAGALPTAQALQALGTGLFINHLHYLNWSDQKTARITGMTRFACFWVENGQIVCPIQDMRFDDSVFSLWGEQLEALTLEQTIIPETLTYDERRLGGVMVPGMLVRELHLTL